MKKSMVLYVIWMLVSVLSFNVLPVSGASESDRIAQLIKACGKKDIESIIRKNRGNYITVSNGGQMEDSFGPPDERYVTVQTILADLRKMHISLSQFENMLGQKSPAKAANRSENHYRNAESMCSAGKYDEAVISAKEALKESETKSGSNSTELSKPLSLLADIQIKRNEYKEAAQYLERLRSIQEKSLGRTSGEVGNTIEKLIAAYEKMGDTENANKLNNLASSRWGGGSQNSHTTGTNTSRSRASNRSGTYIVAGSPVCRSFESANSMREYLSNRDFEAFNAKAESVLDSGECYSIKSDTQVFVTQTRGLCQKFRFKGKLEEYWTWWSAIE